MKLLTKTLSGMLSLLSHFDHYGYKIILKTRARIITLKNIILFKKMLYFSVYVDAGTGTSPIILTIVTSGIFFKRNWKIKVSQILCESATKGLFKCLISSRSYKYI